MKTVVFWETLIRLAHELGRARLSGDPDRIALAQAKHDEYLSICFDADEMIV